MLICHIYSPSLIQEESVLKIFHIMKDKSLSTKIAIYLIFVSLVMTAFMGLISFIVASRVSYNLNINNLISDIAKISINLDNAFKSAESAAIQLFSIPVLQDALSANNNDLLDDYENYNKINNSIKNIKYVNKMINRINIYGMNNVSYSNRKRTGLEYSNYTECSNHFIKNGFLNNVNFNMPVWCNVESSNEDGIYAVQSIVNVRYFYDIRNYNRTGIVVIGIDEKEIYKLFKQCGDDAFIFSKRGCIISKKQKEELNKDISKTNLFMTILGSNNNIGCFKDTISGKKSVVVYCEIKSADAFLVVPTDYRVITSGSKAIGYTTVILFAACTVISIILARSISKELTSSVKRLKKDMGHVKNGNMSVRFEVRSNDEINWLGHNFNIMLDQIDQYIEQVKTKEKSNRNIQLKLIQSQINPHLLYNSLDSVLWHLESDNNNAAHEIINSMSKFFKISLSNGNAIIPLRQEIEHLKNYILLQNLCRGQQISLILDVDENLMNLKIIKLTLQPIAENSILHGFSGYRDDGEIKISVKTNENEVIITAEDNGIGMTEEEINALNHKINLWPVPEHIEGYGLINVNRRIKHLCGENYGIEVFSELCEYTRVLLTYKLISKDWEDDFDVRCNDN
jgi:two-component system sensor histidine kinase YesM